VKVDRTLVIPLLRRLTRTLGIPWWKRCGVRTLADRRGIRLLSVNTVEVDLACFLDWPFLVVLDARGTEGYVSWEDHLWSVQQKERRISRDRADLGSETPDDVRQLCMPPGRVLRSVVEDAVFDGLKHHDISSLDLAVCDNPPRKIPYYRLRPIHFGH
jgi:hypothetical protein